MATDVDGVRSASAAQHAVRLLFLLRGAGEPTSTPPDPPDSVAVIRSEVRLHALDFWLRNPDYLADELLNEVEGGHLAESYLAVAAGLLDDEEPQLRHYPMHRWLYGAFEPLDDALALLETPDLVRITRAGRPGQVFRTQIFLTHAGMEAAHRLEEFIPALDWYVRQIRLVVVVAGDDKGSNLKKRQYQQVEYAETQLGSRIATIADRVRDRLSAKAWRTRDCIR